MHNTGTFDFKGKYKYRAWKALEGMSKDDAKAKYVQLLQAVSVPSTARLVAVIRREMPVFSYVLFERRA